MFLKFGGYDFKKYCLLSLPAGPCVFQLLHNHWTSSTLVSDQASIKSDALKGLQKRLAKKKII